MNCRQFTTEPGCYIRYSDCFNLANYCVTNNKATHSQEDDSNPLTTASIFGTAKAAQEADNVIILQCPQGKDKYLQVRMYLSCNCCCLYTNSCDIFS